MAEISEEDKQKDFEGRKMAAVQAMDAILRDNEVGIRLVLGGFPDALRPMIHYTDMKQYGEETNTKEKPAKKGKRNK